MQRCFMTVVSADYFQGYIPLYIAALRTWSKDTIRIYLRGELSKQTRLALAYAGSGYEIVSKVGLEYPKLPSMTNSLRFVISDSRLREFDYVMITDIDMLLFRNPWEWHIQRMVDNSFFGHHGPKHKPSRPNICAAWTGHFERVAGGMFCVSKAWWDKTDRQRKIQARNLLGGEGGGYREADEVMLANIIKDSRMNVPQNKAFPLEYRGLHLGDFKESMSHRWTNKAKMFKYLSDGNIAAYVKLSKTPQWQKLVRALNNREINNILRNVATHIMGRA